MKAKVFLIGICFILLSCATSKVQNAAVTEEAVLELLFAGDIMAHTELTERNYDSVLSDVEPIIKKADFAFANFESPVNDSLPQSSYPIFNCHSDYADKIISSGFNVFSLANNHTNDLHLDGIKSTKEYFDSKKTEGIFSSGLKDWENAPVKFIVLEKNGIKILFAAVTEVHNFSTEFQWFDYLEPEEISRKIFLRQIEEEKSKSGCDLLVLSFHTAEPEYDLSIAEKSKNFYYSLINSGVDILWINHPHVPKEWETIHTADNRQKIIFYSVGNTVSSQRRNPDFSKPASRKEFKGDSFLFSMKIKKTGDGMMVGTPEPTLITSYITDGKYFVTKKLDDNLIQELKEEGNDKWSSYLSERKKALSKIKGKDTWQ
ncbi:MAG: CapA family protein [Spirochaetales bacterium]|nr:CapA family protein [Spirochaetales bacterium]